MADPLIQQNQVCLRVGTETAEKLTQICQLFGLTFELVPNTSLPTKKSRSARRNIARRERKRALGKAKPLAKESQAQSMDADSSEDEQEESYQCPTCYKTFSNGGYGKYCTRHCFEMRSP